MKGRKKPGGPKEMLLDWLMKKEYNMDYSQLKSKEGMASINTGPAQWQNT